MGTRRAPFSPLRTCVGTAAWAARRARACRRQGQGMQVWRMQCSMAALLALH